MNQTTILASVAALGIVLLIQRFAVSKRKRGAAAKGYSKPLSEYAHVLDIPPPAEYERKPTPYGLGIFSTRDVKKGEPIYSGSCIFIPNVPGAVLVRGGGDQFLELDVITHSVYRKGGIRELYAYDAFTNHSCDPNSYTIYTGGDETKYVLQATKDIKKGDQITCDYELFEWDCKDKTIDACGCGAKICRKRIWGYKHIEDRAAKVALYPFLRDSTRELFHEHFPELAASVAAEAKAAQEKEGN